MLRGDNCAKGMICLALCGVLSATALGAIDLEFRPAAQGVFVGTVAEIGLYVVSDSTDDQLMAAADVILGWDPDYLRLLGNHQVGAVPLLVSGFPAGDPYGLNEVVPPQDGDGLYIAYALLGVPVVATPGGALLTTFRFEALAETSETVVAILPSAGSPLGHTVVYDGTVPGLDVTGTLGAAAVTVAVPCGDLNCDGLVNAFDIDPFVLALTSPEVYVAQFPDCDIMRADINGDGLVNAFDIDPFVDCLVTGGWGSSRGDDDR